MASNIALRKRFEGREDELTRKIQLFGVSTICDQEHISLGAMLNYAHNTLHLESPPIATKAVTEHIDDVAMSFVSALFDKYQKMHSEIDRLRIENQALKDREQQKQIEAKLRLIQLTQALKES